MESQPGGPRIGPQSIHPLAPKPSPVPRARLAPPTEMPGSRGFSSLHNTPMHVRTGALGYVPVGALSRPTGTPQQSMVPV